ncbi:PfkB family carbohydrate kinase [Leptobacterium sp. I13]|uniref:PfkB family carbohydrate kinase n=1 Tax=Leptobacterium meishanense TaxID=3128904 RepID=UPI0030EC317E
MKNVYCIGEILIDFIAERQGNDLTEAWQFTKKAGGAPANVCAATALLGGNLHETYLKDAVIKGAFICFDPNYRVDLWKGNKETFIKACIPFIEKAHLAKFSLEEAQLISGEQSIEKACEKLHYIGATTIAITLGKEGTFIRTKEYQEHVNSISITSVDTTGAGDAFIGCLLQQLSQTTNPKVVLSNKTLFTEMVKRANIAGAITATQYGAIAALPTKEQLGVL